MVFNYEDIMYFVVKIFHWFINIDTKIDLTRLESASVVTLRPLLLLTDWSVAQLSSVELQTESSQIVFDQ